MRKKRNRKKKKGRGLAEYFRDRKPEPRSLSYGEYKKRQDWEYMMSKKARGMRLTGAGLIKARHPRRHK